MTLADFTSRGLVVPHLRGRDAAAVIQELSQALQHEQRVTDLLPFYQAVLNREYMVSTEAESGMAFPHARAPGVKALAFALGRSEEALPWGVNGVRSVRLVFLIAIPATDATQYLQLISGLARLAKDPALVSRLQAAGGAGEMCDVLQQVPVRGQPSLTGRKAAA